MHLEQILTLSLSIISIIISGYSFLKSHRVAKQQNYINEKETYAEQFKSYAVFLYNEYNLLEKNLNEFSSLLCATNTAIGEILDIYDIRGSNASSNSRWFLRHLHANMCRKAVEALGDELVWQTSSRLYSELNLFQKLDIELDFNEKALSEMEVSKFKEQRQFDLYKFMGSELFRLQFLELHHSVNKIDYVDLYNKVITQCDPLIAYLNEFKKLIETPLNELEKNFCKNKFEIFKLHEYSDLYSSFRQFINLLIFIKDSPLTYLSSFYSRHEAPYNTISWVLHIGILIECMNKFICRNSTNFFVPISIFRNSPIRTPDYEECPVQ